MITIDEAITQCVSPSFQQEMRAIVRVESSGNPHAIAIIGGGRMLQQPKTEAQAKAAAELLESMGVRYAAGAAQINHVNFQRFGMDRHSAFNPCTSLMTGESILKDCLIRAMGQFGPSLYARQASWSCYYSGNFREGFDRKGHRFSYVERMSQALGLVPQPLREQPSRGAGRAVAPSERNASALPISAGESSSVFKR